MKDRLTPRGTTFIPITEPFPYEDWLYWPSFVPVMVLIHLSWDTRMQASTPKQQIALVHQRIREGTLQAIRGVGLSWERRIMRAYLHSPGKDPDAMAREIQSWYNQHRPYSKRANKPSDVTPA